tara:strand:- start:13 stop:534 length:522 start_codon:yes stop_codon:yes gene_type:complete
MPGSLVLIQETTVSSAVASVTLTGIDSTYDVYKVVLNKVSVDTENSHLRFRVTVSGSPDTTSNYDKAVKKLRTDTTFTNTTATNDDYGRCSASSTGTGTGETSEVIIYLFNFANANEYSFLTYEEAMLSYHPTLFGSQGGAVHTVAQACDGIQFYHHNGDINGGTFKLYGLKK